MDNRHRAERAAETMDFHAGQTGDPDEVLVDLLTDLMRYCDMTSVDFNQALDMSYQHYLAEGAT